MIPTETTETEARKAPSDTRDTIEHALDTIAAVIRALQTQEATGELAALKRLDWRAPVTLAFARVTIAGPVDTLLARAPDRPALIARLATIAAAMAGARELHAGWKLGGALADIGATPQRLGALLNARGDALIEAVKRTAARLGRDGPLPYRQLGKLLIGELLDPDATEALRFEIARDYARGTRARA